MKLETKKKIDEVIKSRRVKGADVQNTCQYLQNDKQRFCRATTNRSCIGCKFYDPKYSVKAELLAEAIIALENKIIKQKETMTALHKKEVELLNSKIMFYKTCGTAQPQIGD